MENEKPIVRASRANFGKTLLGGFQVAYRCPRCKQELITKNNAIAAGDMCPHCQASFVFDDQIKEAFAAVLAEKQSREAEKERVREGKIKSEQARWAAEQARQDAEAKEQEARDREQRVLEWEREQTVRREQQRVQRDNATNLGDAYGCLHAIIFVGAAGASLMLFASFVLFSSGNSLNDHAVHGAALFVVSLSALASLSLVYAFARILGAIHSVLVMILERLNSTSNQN